MPACGMSDCPHANPQEHERTGRADTHKTRRGEPDVIMTQLPNHNGELDERNE